MRLLIVEDEPLLCEQLRHYLAAKGFAVDKAHTGKDGLFMAKEYPIDLAIIDLGLPDFSGIELIKRLRDSNVTVPVLILTARSSWQDKVEGLHTGADDYLVKPFQYEELLARIQALIRRAAKLAHPVIQHGPVTVDINTRDVSVAGVKVRLTAFQYKVLEYLLLHKGEWITKTQLTFHLYDEDEEPEGGSIEAFILQIRNKLDPQRTLKLIESKRGQGYRIPPTLP